MFCRLAVFNEISKFLTCGNLLTVICMVPTGLLLYDIVADFLVRKPTAISQNQIDFNPRYFPDLLICRHPPIDKDVLKTFGYQPVFFWQGRTGEWDNGKFIGWNGLDGNQDSTTILNEILSVSADEELIGEIYFQDKGGEKVSIKAKTRMLLYPQGRCLVIKPPFEKIKSFKFLYLKSFAPVKFNHSELPSLLKVFFIDPINDPLIYPMDIQMKG